MVLVAMEILDMIMLYCLWPLTGCEMVYSMGNSSTGRPFGIEGH